jgi:signal transduction histidine kinase
MQFSPKLARYIFIAAAVILLIFSYTLYNQVKVLINSYNQVNQSYIVKLKLEQVFSTTKDAETAQQGFLLTNDSTFLQPYRGAYEKSQKLLSELNDLTSLNYEIKNNLNSLATLIEIRFRTFKTLIDQYNYPDINQATKTIHLRRGKASMDSIRYHIAVISDIEEKLIKKRENSKKIYGYTAPFYAFLFIVSALGILVFFYDKTMKQLKRSKKLLQKLRNLNGKLKQKNHELELYNKELDSFTYIASHDLKEPLRKITTYSNLIAETEYPKFSFTNKMHYQKVQNAVKRMQGLLDDLLQYSYATTSAKVSEMVDLNTIVAATTKNLAEEIEENDTTINTNELPIIKGSPFQLKQLFENLIINSIKYKRLDEKPFIHIESTIINQRDIKHKFYKRSNVYYRITFSDNGLGFEQVFADKVFQVFQRVHPDTDQDSTGMGLAICKKIVQNHNGFITVTSTVNVGTTFEIYFPI